jgi:hypothetical protein
MLAAMAGQFHAHAAAAAAAAADPPARSSLLWPTIAALSRTAGGQRFTLLLQPDTRLLIIL